MSCDADECDHSWHYAGSRTLAGALQRGLGRGADRARFDPAAPDLVADCLRRDYRWDWQVDERAVYLARLVRDLELPIRPITDRLFAAPTADDDNEFSNTLDVLEVLGRAGVDGVVEEVRRYIRQGVRWLEALQTMAGCWPAAWWDDLCPTAIGRLDTAAGQPLWRSPPWSTWATRDARIAAEVDAAQRRPGPPRPFADESTPALLVRLRDPGHAIDRNPVLRELRRRPPEPGLLEIVDGLLADAGSRALPGAIERLGAMALPAARIWAATPGHRLHWTALRLLAAHGDGTDAAALVAGLDWLDSHRNNLCGYHELVRGLTRIGGWPAAEALPRVRRLWFSPHSYERFDYLKAWLALDPDHAQRSLVEGLWDCETGVRLLSAQHAPRNDMTGERLRYLRDDPIEAAEVRAAAMTRLTGHAGQTPAVGNATALPGQ